MDNIINGQLWIDKNSPYRLKYTANGTIYSVDVSSDYFISDSAISSENPLVAGTVVAFKNGGIRKAIFPDDIDNVIGVIGNTITEDTSPISILKTGIITLTKEEFNKINNGSLSIYQNQGTDTFYGEWKTETMKGAPVYWFIGKETVNNNAYTFEYENSNHGQITLLTPTGRRWRRLVDGTHPIDCSFNVSYDNLPIIGYVDSIKGTNTSNPTDWSSIDIYLNVNKFDTTLEWSWPFDNQYSLSGLDTITVRHGLFPKSFNDFSNYFLKQRCDCSIIALDKNTDDEYRVSASVQNYYGQYDVQNPNEDPRTEIFIGNAIEDYRFRITGTVNLKFDRTTQGATNG